MQKEFWRDKKVIITGATGFVGSHLFSYLVNHGAYVVGMSRRGKNRANHVIVDMVDTESVKNFFKKFSPSICFHLASDALVEVGQENPWKTFHNNIVSSLNILEVSRTMPNLRLIMASTVHVYGSAPLPYRESEPALPSRPYETSKACVDLMAQSYVDSYNLPVLIPRFVNIYGPGDTNSSRIIPKTISSLLDGQSPTLWGGNALRDYLYIDDVICAYDLLGKISLSHIGDNKIINFATGRLTTAKDVISYITLKLGKQIKIKKIHDKRTNEVIIQKVDWTKAREILEWKPKVDLDTGLDKTIAWFKRHKLS